MSTEYKEYLLPLREERVRWDVLKTIVSFLNSYGGVLYLGIDQTKGTVMGQKLEKKEQDTFKLFMKQLL
jgi:predicted HTH transcriptional regulator